MGGRHKPFPTDDEAHPSHASPLSATGGVEADTDRGTLLLHWATELSPPRGPSRQDQASDSGCHHLSDFVALSGLFYF